MPLGPEGLLIFVLVIFPGVLARSEAQRVGPLPSDTGARSWIQELADALAYSAVLVPLAGAVAIRNGRAHRMRGREEGGRYGAEDGADSGGGVCVVWWEM